VRAVNAFGGGASSFGGLADAAALAALAQTATGRVEPDARDTLVGIFDALWAVLEQNAAPSDEPTARARPQPAVA
jgi:hypothetical protein